jgi:translocation and assembly module TamB
VLAQVLPLGEDRVSGHYQLALDITGTVKSPDASGRLAVDNGRYAGHAFGTTISGISAELTGDRTRLRLTRFEANDGSSGKISASGNADLAANPEPRLDFQARLSQFRIANSDQARASADGEVRVEGGLSTPKLFARLTMPKGDFRIPDRLPTRVVKLDVIEIDSRQGPGAAASAPAEKPAAAKPALRVSLDAQLDIPGQAFVRGRGLDSEWRGKLTIAGTSDQPAITGGLEVVHGTLNLLGKNFSVRRGSITFPSGLADPQLDVLAEAVTADITAQVMLTGSASAPKVQLTSQPQVPQDEILARVLFGKNAGQITPAQGLQLAYAAASLADGGPDVLEKLRRATGLDRLALGSDASSNALGPPQVNRNTTGNTNATPSVSGGKYIAPGVFVGVEEGADPSTGTGTPTTRSKVEIEITPQISAESRVGANGSSEVGITWKRDY